MAHYVGRSELARRPAVAPARTVFEHRHYPTVLEENLLLPSGTTVTRVRYADHREGRDVPDGIMGICMDGGRVLLSRQYNPGAERVAWEFPGGGTTPRRGLRRCRPKGAHGGSRVLPARVAVPVWRYLLNNRRTGWGIRTYLCTDVEERSLPSDEGELIESYWVPVAKVDEMIRDGEIDNVTVLAGWAMLRAATE